MSAFPLPVNERCSHAPLRDIAERGSLSRAECSDCDTLIDLSAMPLHSDADLATASKEGYDEGYAEATSALEATTDNDDLEAWWCRWEAKAEAWMRTMAEDAPWL